MTYTYKNAKTGETFRSADRIPPLDRNDGWEVTEDESRKADARRSSRQAKDDKDGKE